MTNDEIIDSIDTIFYNAEYTGAQPYERFYRPHRDKEGKSYYKFENETIALLKALYEKIPSVEAKEFFLKSLRPTLFLIRMINPVVKFAKYAGSKRDFIFVFYIKIKQLNDALGFLDPGKAFTSDTTKFLHALLEILTFEPNIFSEDYLKKILEIVEGYQSFIRQKENYDKRAKASLGNGGAFIPMWDEKQESEYKNSDSRAIYESEEVLNTIKGTVYKIKKHRLKLIWLEGINLEVNQDQEQVQNLIKNFGFSLELEEALSKINEKVYIADDKFDFKGCIDLIRSFLNELCKSVASRVEEVSTIQHSEDITEMGKAMSYLRRKDIAFLDAEEDSFVTSFNALLSQKGVHKLTSDKEYARISKNVAIETGLFLLERLSKYRRTP